MPMKLMIPDSVLNSFEIRDQLNPKFWQDNKIDPEIRVILLRAAKNFIDSWPIEHDIQIRDITVTGSLAAFNWSSFSDIDVHVVIDYGDLNDDEDLVEKFFLLVKFKWDIRHNIELHGHEIECYAEDVDNTPNATGIYSLVKNDWVREPTKEDPAYDERDVIKKANYFVKAFENIKNRFDEGNFESVVRDIERLKLKIRKMRVGGLDRGGEYSVENLAFKVLRRTGILQKLNDLRDTAADRSIVTGESIDDTKNVAAAQLLDIEVNK